MTDARSNGTVAASALGRRRPAAIALALALLLGAGLAPWAGGPARADSGDAQAFLQRLNDTVEAELVDGELDDAERERRFRTLFRAHFDLPTIGRFVTARYWRGASEEERQDFLQVFEDAMVQRFLPLFSSYERESFIIRNARPDERSDRFVIVSSTIKRDGEEDLSVDWRLLRNDGFKVVDIMAEGVSMAITLRSEYVSAIRIGGGRLSALTEQLRSKVEAGGFKPKLVEG